jgi:hypothetical protein
MVGIGGAIALVVLLVAGSVAAYVILNAPDPKIPTRDLVTRMAARDSGAAALVDSDDSLRALAVQMGIATLPGSASLAVENLQVAVPKPETGASALPAGDWAVTASYTLRWTGRDFSGKVDQVLSAVVYQGKDGKLRLERITVEPALTVDLAAYFGESGTSQDDALAVAADLRAGTKWIPGLNVGVVETAVSLDAPAINTSVPGHLSTWSKVTSPGSPGSQTVWNVNVADLSTTYLTISPASLVATQPVAAQVNVGSLTSSDAEDQAIAAAKNFWAAVDAGNVSKANALVAAGVKLDGSALASMKGWGTSKGNLGDSYIGAFAEEASNGPEVSIGDFTYVLGAGGTWGIDTSQGHFVQAVLGSNGHYYTLTGRETQNGVTVCTTKITIKLARVTFYTDVPPEAALSFSSSNGSCYLDDTIVAATAGWKGNGGVALSLGDGQQGTEPGKTVERTLTLPDGARSGLHPVWIKLNKYGFPESGVYAPVMKFSTK